MLGQAYSPRDPRAVTIITAACDAHKEPGPRDQHTVLRSH